MYMVGIYRSYGVTLWFPSYVDQLARNSQTTPTVLVTCNATVTDTVIHVPRDLSCVCPPKIEYTNVTLDIDSIDQWWVWHGVMNDSLINGGHFQRVWLEGVVWNNVNVRDALIDSLIVLNSSLNNVEFINSSVVQSYICGVDLNNAFINESMEQSCGDSSHLTPPTCSNEEQSFNYNEEYFNDLIITSSGFIGNFVSAIAVYYFIRSYWLGK